MDFIWGGLVVWLQTDRQTHRETVRQRDRHVEKLSDREADI